MDNIEAKKKILLKALTKIKIRYYGLCMASILKTLVYLVLINVVFVLFSINFLSNGNWLNFIIPAMTGFISFILLQKNLYKIHKDIEMDIAKLIIAATNRDNNV